MKITIDEIANPTIHFMDVLPGHYTDSGSPTITKRWAMKGEDLFIQVVFTKKVFFRHRRFVSYINEKHIRLEEDVVFFCCEEENK